MPGLEPNEAKLKAIFLDRDDTLIHDPGYINDPDQVQIIEGVPAALKELSSMGFKLVIVSNQSAVARGIITEKKLEQIHDRLKELLAKDQVSLDAIYFCPYYLNGAIKKYRKDSEFRKPNPGMLFKAAEEMNIDLNQSWMIGDHSKDVEAGLRAGCKTILIRNGSDIDAFEENSVNPDFYAVNLTEAVNVIKKQIKTNKSQNEIIENITNNTPQTENETIDTYPPKEPSNQEIKTDQLLTEILNQLKKNHRQSMFGEFSTVKILAALSQIAVLVCLIAAVWFLMSPQDKSEAVKISLGFAIIMQLMTLTFNSAQDRK